MYIFISVHKIILLGTHNLTAFKIENIIINGFIYKDNLK
jgi:hypothetical protein